MNRATVRWLCALVAFFALALLFYREIWLGHGGHLRWIGWDNVESFWPDLSYLASSLRAGEWPLWCPYDRGGYPMYADTTAGLLYPPNYVPALLGAVAGEVPPWVMQLKAVFHEALAACLLYLFLRSRRLPIAAAAAGGIAVLASSPWMGFKANGTIWNLAWAPLVWLCIDRLLDGAEAPGWWRRAAALAGAIFLAASAGPPPGFFYVILLGSAYALVRFAPRLREQARAGRLRVFLPALARSLAVVVALLALLLPLVLLPTAEAATFSNRAAPTARYAIDNGMQPAATLAGLFAAGRGSAGAYVGVVVLALAFVGVAARTTADRGLPRFFLVLGGFFLVLAFGADGKVLPLLVEHLPGFGLFRDPTRYGLLWALCLSVPAAYGVAALLDPGAPRRRLIAVGVAVALVLAGIVWAATQGANHLPGPGASGALLAAGGAVMLALLFLPARLRAAAVFALPLLVWIDGELFVRPSSISRTEPPPSYRDDAHVLHGLGDVTREWRVFDEYAMEHRAGLRLRIRELRGYPSGDPLASRRYLDVLRRLRQDPQLVEAFNVRWAFHGPHSRGSTGHFIRHPPSIASPGHFRALDGHRFETLHPVPIVAWYGRVVLAVHERSALDALVAAEDAAGRRAAAVVMTADLPRSEAPAFHRLAELPLSVEPPAEAPFRLTYYGTTRVAFEIDAPAEGVVVLNEAMYPGWRVRVNGATAVPVQANYLLRGVRVAAGRHVIEWTFAPPRLTVYVVLFALGAAALLAAAIAAAHASWRERKAGQKLPSSG